MTDEPLEVELEIRPAPGGADPAPPRRVRRIPRRGLAVLALLSVVAGGAGLLVLRDDKPDPDAALRDAQQALDDVDGFRFELEAEVTTSTGDGGVGTTETRRYTAEGDRSTDVWRVETRTPDVLREVLVEGDDVYTRESGPRSRTLERLRWNRPDDEPGMHHSFDQEAERADDVGLDSMTRDNLWVAVATDWYLGDPGGVLFLADGFNHGPDGFLRLIEEMAASRVVEEADGTRRIDGHIRARGTTEYVPGATVSLLLAADGEPERLRFAVRQGGASTSFDVRFSDWDEPVHLQVPTRDEIDETPDIDEAALTARATYMDPVWPTAVPEGWVLSTLVAGEAEAAFGEGAGTSCQTIDVEWTDPNPDGGDDDPAVGFLRITIATLACATVADPTPFAPGGPAGLPSRPRDQTSVEVQVGDSVVQVHSALPDDQLVPVLASLTPVDIDTLIAAAAKPYN